MKFMQSLVAYCWRDVLPLSSLALTYCLLVIVAFSRLTTPDHLSMLWLPSGLGFAAILTWGSRFWPAILLGSLLGYFLILDRAWQISLAIAFFCNTLEPLLAAVLLRRFFGLGLSLRHPMDFLALGLSSAVASAWSALMGNWILLSAGYSAQSFFLQGVTQWWMGDFLSLLLIGPLLLVWRNPPLEFRNIRWLAEFAVCYLLAFFAGQIVFKGWFAEIFGAWAKGYWIFILVVWAALRFRLHGVLPLILMIAMQALSGALENKGLFAEDLLKTNLLNYWFYILALTVVGVPLSLLIDLRMRMESSLRASEERFRTMNDFLPQQVWTALPDGRIDYVNQRVIEFCGRGFEQIIGDGWHGLVHPEDLASCITRWLRSVQTGESYKHDFRLKDHSGQYRWCFVQAVALYDGDGQIQRWYGTNTDITEKKKTEEMIWRQANFDSLTGLPNRQMFHDRLKQEIGKAHRAGLRMALLFIDLDRFKEVNDTLGHDKGDELLQDAAKRLQASVREADTVARLGGDEFTVIIGELDNPDEVENIVMRILVCMTEPFQLGGEQVYVSASVGVTLYPDDASGEEGLLKNADQAMYAAKAAGRNRSSYFTPVMQEAAQAKMRLGNDLRIALAQEQFEVYFQPIVEFNSGMIRKAEALIRWNHPIIGLINPNDFLPVAEDTGLIIEIGDWMFREAAVQSLIWRKDFPEFQLSVNKSPAQFQRDRLNHAGWFADMQELGVPPKAIVIEITEDLLLNASQSVKSQLYDFRDAGMQVAIDDFGTGHSSLSYLKKFDIDYLKIDSSFVRNLKSDNDDMALCEAIIVMAHKLGIKVIAEGVETQEQASLLAKAGCDFGQGFYYSKPVPVSEFELLLYSQMSLRAEPATAPVS